LEIGQRRAQTTFIIISLGVLQIVKTLDKIVQFSNFIILVYILHTQQRNEVPGDNIFKLNNFI